MPDISIPKRDAEFLLWAQAFASGVGSAPWQYSVSPADAQTIANAVQEYEAALAVARSPETHTPGTINRKDTARNAAVNLLRQYAAQFRANNGISDQALIDIGIKPRNRYPSLRHCPQTSPVISFGAATPGQFTLHYKDSIACESKQKPFGATRLELYAMLIDPGSEKFPTMPVLAENSPEMCGQPRNWAWYVGSFSRNPMSVTMPNPNEARLAVFWGRWANERGEHGPWSQALATMPVGLKVRHAKLDDPKPKNKMASDAAMKLAA